MGKRIVHIAGIGNVVLEKSHRAKRLNITLKPFRDIRVAVPRGMSYTQAETFVRQRLDWIQKQQPKIQNLEKGLSIFDEHTNFSTRNHRLSIERSHAGQLTVRAVHGRIHVNCPLSLEITSHEVQTAIRAGIERAWRKEAKRYLPGRVKTLADQHGLTYRRLCIKNIKSRWGSCSAQNTIHLSLHLMRLPDHLIDYVILHELVHTIEKSHNHRFWNVLERVSGNARGLDRELKDYTIAIY